MFCGWYSAVSWLGGSEFLVPGLVFGLCLGLRFYNLCLCGMLFCLDVGGWGFCSCWGFGVESVVVGYLLVCWLFCLCWFVLFLFVDGWLFDELV